MTPGRRRMVVRGAGVVGALAQLLVGLMVIVIFPAAFVSAITGVAGVRLVRRDVEAASMRFGVALLASGVGVVFGFVSGALPALAAAVLSTACFAFAWRGVQQLASAHRAAFGIRHRDWTRRDTRLQERREALRNGRAGDSSAPDGGANGTAVPDDPDAWWADLD